MRLLLAVLSIGFLSSPLSSRAEEPAKANGNPSTRATFLITGLHCPPCTRTVESSLARINGVRSAKVDWQTKTAQIEFNEKVLPAQTLAQRIAATPHMMGAGMQYGGWLALKVPDVKNDASAAKAKKVLGELKGVKQVVAYAKQQSIGVQFAESGKLSTRDLIDALDKADLKATN